MQRVLALVGDLMLGVRIQSAAHAMDYTFQAAGTLAELRVALDASGTASVVLDLTDPAFPLIETMEILNGAGDRRPRVLAFYPHVMRELEAKAKRAGCTLIVPRSRFMAELPRLLQLVMAIEPAMHAPHAGADHAIAQQQRGKELL